jgi:hypothetical protein
MANGNKLLILYALVCSQIEHAKSFPSKKEGDLLLPRSMCGIFFAARLVNETHEVTPDNGKDTDYRKLTRRLQLANSDRGSKFWNATTKLLEAKSSCSTRTGRTENLSCIHKTQLRT